MNDYRPTFNSLYIVSILVTVILNSFAADGIIVTQAQSKYWHSAGKRLLMYTIENSKVIDKKTILEGNGGTRSPELNQSGTHVVFSRSDESGSYISMLALDNPGVYADIFKITDEQYAPPQYVKWLTDGRIIYWHSGTFKYRILTITNDNGNVEINDALHAFVEYEGQGGRYMDFSGDGAKLFWRPYGCKYDETNCSWETSKRSFNARVVLPEPGVLVTDNLPGVLDGAGCGCAVSPSGNTIAYYSGSGHNAIKLKKWEGESLPALIYNDISTWTDPVGSGGDNNRFSVNSDRWLTTLPGPSGDSRFLKNGSECVAVNLDTARNEAINVSAYERQSDENYMYVGCLWVSSKADVNENLWHYVQDRETWKAYWNQVMTAKGASLPIKSNPSYFKSSLQRNQNASFAQFDIRGRAIHSVEKAPGLHLIVDKETVVSKRCSLF